MGYDSDFTRLATRVDGVDPNAASDPNQLDDNNAQVQANIVAVLQHKTLISGLEISNDTDTEHDINIAAGSAVDSTGVTLINLTAEMTKRIDAAWAAGDDEGGLDTGSVANTTWYYIYVIIKDSDSSVDVLISASKTSPTMPSGYTYFRRIRGAVLTNGSANILQFHQKDNLFLWVVPVVDYSETSMANIRILVPVSVPPDFIGKHYCQIVDTSTSYGWIGPVLVTDFVPALADCNMHVSSASPFSNIVLDILSDASSQVAIRVSLTNTDGYIATNGFVDPALS